jgi:hypothetical protein
MDEQDFRDMTARMVDAGKITEEERQQLLEAYATGEITAEDLPLAMEEFSTSLLDALMLAAVLEWLLREEDDSGGLVLPAGKSAKDLARWAASLRQTAIQRQREAADGSDKITDRTAEHWEEQVDRLRTRYQLIGGPSRDEADQETHEEAREEANEILKGLSFQHKRRLARDFVDFFHQEANQRTEQYLFGDFDDGLRRWQVAMREAMRDDLMAMAAAGKGHPLHEDDLNRLGRVWRRQQSHLQRFAEEIAARREAGNPMTEKQIKARARMYAGAEYSAFWRFASEEKGQGWVVDWHSQDDGGVCLTPGHMVQTPEGEKAIEHVEVGDQLKTGTGDYSRVTKTWERLVEKTVTISAGDTEVTVTKDHPILVEREGELLWADAGTITTEDFVFLQDRDKPVGGGSFADGGTVKPSKLEPFAFGKEGFPLVRFFHAVQSMPVNPVNFNKQRGGGQVEVEKKGFAFGSLDRKLLPESDSNFFKRLARLPFDVRFPVVGTIATETAEDAPPLFFELARRDAKVISTVTALNNVGRAAAGFGAVMPIVAPVHCLRNRELSAATLAILVNRICSAAFNRAMRVTVGSGFRDGEVFSALGAILGHSSESIPTLGTAKCWVTSDFMGESLTTVLALRLDALDDVAAVSFPFARRATPAPIIFGQSVLAFQLVLRAAVNTSVNTVPRVFALLLITFLASTTAASIFVVFAVTRVFESVHLPAINTGVTGHQNRSRLERLASNNVRSNVHNVAVNSYEGKVYDVSLEDGHDFYAEGMVVHNCPNCLTADKTMSPFPAGYPHPVPGSPWCRGGGACRCWLTFSFDPEAFVEAESRWEERGEQRRREYYDVMRTDPLLNMDAGGVVTASGQGRRMN